MDDQKIIEWLFAVALGTIGMVVTIVTWVAKNLHSRVDKIEEDYVPISDFEKAWQGLREDRQLMHRENREALRRIEEKIDESEGKNSNHRHSMNNEIQKLVAGTAVVESKVEDLRRATSK